MYALQVQEWRTKQLRNQWVSWINLAWQHLTSGAKVEAPWMLPAPGEAGFELIEIAHPTGQSRDWGMSMADGSRIHIHEFADGRRVVHRDVHDPKRGLGPTLAHLMQETPYGVLAIGLGVLIYANVRSA